MMFEWQNVKSCMITAGLVSTLISTLALTGCQATQKVVNKFDNGSLNYQKTQQLDPIVLPAEQKTAAFTPLYPMPYVRENTITLTNENGTRYELPPPFRMQTTQSNTLDESLF